jgi:hypothetical protein
MQFHQQHLLGLIQPTLQIMKLVANPTDIPAIGYAVVTLPSRKPAGNKTGYKHLHSVSILTKQHQALNTASAT